MNSLLSCLLSVCLTGAIWLIDDRGSSFGDEPPPNENQSTSERSDDNVVFRGRCVRSEDGQPVADATVRFYPRRQYSSRAILSKIVEQIRRADSRLNSSGTKKEPEKRLTCQILKS